MSELQTIHHNAAGIDIGSEKIFISVKNQPVVSFGTFTEHYVQAVLYLKEHGVTTVAMEATGVYWITLFYLIEAAGIDVCLVNARYVKNVPGRKSDVQDCQWLRQLHEAGLLSPCFIPDETIRQLRSYVRLREDHIATAASHIQHMQKALILMNIKVQNVISQINGVSGMRIISAIIAGERNAEQLATLCEPSILNKKRSLVIASLKGNFAKEHLFALKQAVDAYTFYQSQIAECDDQIEQFLDQFTEHMPPPSILTKVRPSRHHQPDINNLHVSLLKMTNGNDPSQITGLSDKAFLEILAETGTELEKHWATEKHFTSWLALSPPMHQSGKSHKRRKVKKQSRAGQIFRKAAISVAGGKHIALTAFYKRIKSRKGFLVAQKATARKLAVMYYNVMTKGVEFVERGIKKYEQQIKEQQLRSLKKRAQELGLQVIPV